MAFAVGLLERGRNLVRQRNAFHLHEPATADADPAPLDGDCDPMAHLVLCRVHGRNIQPFLVRLLQDGARDRVVEAVFGGCRIPQDVHRRIAVGRNDLADLRAFARQRAGFVEKHRIDFAE